MEERRSLANAKGILADMIVDILNGSSTESAQDQLSAGETMRIFQDNGFVLGLNGLDRVNNAYLFTFDKQ